MHYRPNIKYTSDENKENYQLVDHWLRQNQILRTNITRTVRQTVRRVTNKILGVEHTLFVTYRSYYVITRPKDVGLLKGSD